MDDLRDIETKKSSSLSDLSSKLHLLSHGLHNRDDNKQLFFTIDVKYQVFLKKAKKHIN